MAKDKMTTETPKKEFDFVLEPIQELEGLEMDGSAALVCDMETGICGPVNKEKESK